MAEPKRHMDVPKERVLEAAPHNSTHSTALRYFSSSLLKAA